jgi:hypothetical protein
MGDGVAGMEKLKSEEATDSNTKQPGSKGIQDRVNH